MNVFRLGTADRYQWLTLVNEADDWETIYQFNGTPIGAAWRPLRVETFDEEGESEQPIPSDCPSLFAGVPTLSLRAAEVLQPILDRNGELLPLNCEEGDYFIFHVTRVVDALDEAGSEIVRFPDGKKIMHIKHFIFFASLLNGVDMFKLPQQLLGSVFVTDRFVQAVRQAGLVGFNFEWLWAVEQSSASPVLQSTNVQ